MEKKFVRLNAFEGLLSAGLNPISIQVNKLNNGGYRLQAIVVNKHKVCIEDAVIIKEDYRLKALERNHCKE